MTYEIPDLIYHGTALRDITIQNSDLRTIVDEEKEGSWKIVILPNNWVLAGKFYKNGSSCRLESAVEFLNEPSFSQLSKIAEDGPSIITSLPTIHFHESHAIIIDCNNEKWRHIEIENDK